MDTARRTIHDLFREGYIDDRHATAALLAIDLGRQRVERGGGPRRGSANASERDRGVLWTPTCD